MVVVSVTRLEKLSVSGQLSKVLYPSPDQRTGRIVST
jgi:hypothetical protein